MARLTCPILFLAGTVGAAQRNNPARLQGKCHWAPWLGATVEVTFLRGTLTLVTAAPRAAGNIYSVFRRMSQCTFVSKHDARGNEKECPKAVNAWGRPIGWPPPRSGVNKGGAETWGQWEEFQGLFAGVNDCHALGVICFDCGTIFCSPQWLQLWCLEPADIFVRKEDCSPSVRINPKVYRGGSKATRKARTSLNSGDLLHKWVQRLTIIPLSTTRGRFR